MSNNYTITFKGRLETIHGVKHRSNPSKEIQSLLNSINIRHGIASTCYVHANKVKMGKINLNILLVLRTTARLPPSDVDFSSVSSRQMLHCT